MTAPLVPVLCTIHGVNSESDGLTYLVQSCQDRVPGLVHEVVFWEKYKPQMLLEESVRESVCTIVRYRLESVARRYPQSDLVILAHSYGTLAFVGAMQGMIVGFQAKAVIFVGSIVPRRFPWDGWLRSGTVGWVLNIARPWDWVVSRSGWLGGGYSGTRGFIRDVMDVVNHFKNGGHSAYYPDDVDDVVQVLNGVFSRNSAATYQNWIGGLSAFARLRYRTFWTTRILR